MKRKYIKKYKKCTLCGCNSWIISIDMCYNCEI